jgi:hypothetical protein
MERATLIDLLRKRLIEHTQGYTRTNPDYELMGELFIEGFVQLGPLADDLLAELGPQ